ncbi:hypothetical protein [Brevibacillus halotolerans]|uniref:hypothetical protein n=1 Tax=Brevibacillus halotolerans TaxID=1507437 RepID=UPI0015EF5D61|nr:hypothetical protein [Brevibacillus halotolerans]MBA4532657.1 hypothetical protein [Brevibacillus halotolerans]
MREFFCKCKKATCFTAIIFLSLLVILSGCQEKKDDGTLINNNEELVISIYDNEGKSSIVEVDAEKKTEKDLVNNETVWLNGKLSDNKQYLVYTSARGDGPWDIFLLDKKNKKFYQVTNDTLGQLNPRFGDKEGKTIYSIIIGSTFPVSKIAKVDVQKKDSIILDAKQSDRAVEMYDISKNKIIGAFVSEKENTARWKEANKNGGNLKQILYSIYEMNLDGSDMNLITSIKAINIDSIAYGPDGNSIILGGENVNKDEGSGIYKLSLPNKTLTTILTDQMIKKSRNPILSEIGPRRLAVLSKNERFIYFAGIPSNGKEVNFKGITSKIRCIYKYDIGDKEIKKVYEYKKPAIITDLTVTY